MKTVMTAVVISAAAIMLAGDVPSAGADLLSSGFAAGGPALKCFDLQRDLTGSEIPVSEMQREMHRELPAGPVPSMPSWREKRPVSAGSNWEPQAQTKHSLF